MYFGKDEVFLKYQDNINKVTKHNAPIRIGSHLDLILGLAE